jgi:hypothetical protein
MSRSSPSRLLKRAEVPRESRMPTRMVGQCSLRGGAAEDVLVVDLTPHGCRLLGLSAAVSRDAPLTLWLGTAGPITGKLKWAKKASVGVAFDTPVDMKPAD